MALIYNSKCRFCEEVTSWIRRDFSRGENCRKCGNSWWTMQEAIRRRDENHARDKRVVEVLRLAEQVDFVTMRPFKKRARAVRHRVRGES